jgi:hypothetical protein
VEGNYNSIKGNTLQGKALIMGGNFNTATENTIEDCTDFAVKPSNGTNWFYLNNFINNTYISKTLPVPSAANWAILPQPHIAPFKWQSIPNGWEAIYPDNLIFDNGTFGNYYSDYTGKDDNNDGVGDTPYFIGGTLQDNYPLIEPFKAENTQVTSAQTQEEPQETVPQQNEQQQQTEKQEPSPIIITSLTGVLVAISLGLLIQLRKHNRTK